MKAAQLNNEKGVWIQDIPVQEYYTVQEASIVLYVGGPSVYSAIKRGTLKGVRINGVTHVSHDALVEYINKRGTGRAPVDVGNAIIEEINPERDSERKAVEMVDDVKTEAGESSETGEQRKTPLDFLDD